MNSTALLDLPKDLSTLDDLHLVIDGCLAIEKCLKTHFGATGNNLKKLWKTCFIRDELSWKPNLKYIHSQRNRRAHELVVLQNRPRLEQAIHSMRGALEALLEREHATRVHVAEVVEATYFCERGADDTLGDCNMLARVGLRCAVNIFEDHSPSRHLRGEPLFVRSLGPCWDRYPHTFLPLLQSVAAAMMAHPCDEDVQCSGIGALLGLAQEGVASAWRTKLTVEAGAIDAIKGAFKGRRYFSPPAEILIALHSLGLLNRLGELRFQYTNDYAITYWRGALDDGNEAFLGRLELGVKPLMLTLMDLSKWLPGAQMDRLP